MVLKDIDNKAEDIKILKNLYNKSSSEKQKKLILKDLKTLESGYLSEKDNAYYLDFEFKDSKKHILIHDIRLEYNGLTAQFDHILITPIGIYVLESKSFKGVLTINNDTSLTVNYGQFSKTYPSPIEQCKRHSKLLKQFIEDKIELPTRIKLLGGIDYYEKVLINPKTTVTNKTLPKNFIRADVFATERIKEIDNLSGATVFFKATKILNSDLRLTIANKIIDAHKPLKFDYQQKYKIPKKSQEETKELICPRCKEGKLIKRVRKKDTQNSKYKSNEFLGCSRFPKCRFTKELEKSIEGSYLS